MGFNQHFPRAVIFGPKQYQGKQLDDYSTQQCIGHIEHFVGYIRQGLEVGNFIQIQMDFKPRLFSITVRAKKKGNGR